jgi:cytochrome c55X
VARLALIVGAALGLVVTGAWAAAEPDAQRQAELIYLLRQDCGACHGMTLKGGLGPPLVPAALAGRAADELVATVLDGRPGTPMPPWRFSISPDEAGWLVGRMQAGLDDEE